MLEFKVSMLMKDYFKTYYASLLFHDETKRFRLNLNLRINFNKLKASHVVNFIDIKSTIRSGSIS